MTRWVAQTRENYVSVTPYNYTDTTIHGFQGTHQPAIWMGESAQVVVVPGAGTVQSSFARRGMRFSHEDERTTPSYYRVRLDALEAGGSILAEQSASAFFLFTPPLPTLTEHTRSLPRRPPPLHIHRHHPRTIRVPRSYPRIRDGLRRPVKPHVPVRQHHYRPRRARDRRVQYRAAGLYHRAEPRSKLQRVLRRALRCAFRRVWDDDDQRAERHPAAHGRDGSKWEEHARRVCGFPEGCAHGRRAYWRVVHFGGAGEEEPREGDTGRYDSRTDCEDDARRVGGEIGPGAGPRWIAGATRDVLHCAVPHTAGLVCFRQVWRFVDVNTMISVSV